MSDGELNSEVPPLGDGRDWVGPVRATATLVVVALATLVLLPLHILLAPFERRRGRRMVVLWHRLALRLLGVRTVTTGMLGAERPMLLLANHASWLDVLVLGSVAPAVFVARREVRHWPFVGLLTRLAGTVYVDGNKWQATAEASRAIARCLEARALVVLFAEGLSSGGNGVLPFRSSLVGAALSNARGLPSVSVQPVALAYVRQNGLPLGRQNRADVAWCGAMDLFSHIRHVARRGAIDVRVVFGAVTRSAGELDRKQVAHDAGSAVRRVVAGLNAGRSPDEMLDAERRRRFPA